MSWLRQAQEVKKPRKHQSYFPLYTKLHIPKRFNPNREELLGLTHEQFHQWVEDMRLYFLQTYEEKHTPVGAGNKSLSDIITNLQKFNTINTKEILTYEDGKQEPEVLKSFNKWSSVVSHWFPEKYDTKIKSCGEKSVMDFLRDKNRFHKRMDELIIKDSMYLWKDKKHTSFFPQARQIFKFGGRSQPPANFSGAITKHIITTHFSQPAYRNQKEVIFLDPCMGWGGRLVGALAACSHPCLQNKQFRYIGTDVNTATHDRFQMIVNFWKEYVNPDIQFTLEKSILPAEELLSDFQDYYKKCDLVLTSPPYFNREMYSNDMEQSYRLYPTYEEWREGFLRPTLCTIYMLMKPGGELYWNIANIKTGKNVLPLERDSCLYLDALMEHRHTYKMVMNMGIGNNKNKQKRESGNWVKVEGKYFKYEPIFHYQKK